MKTAVSLPDHVFDAADQLAKRLGVSRSELYATAVAEFVAKHRSSEVTDLLNAVHATDEARLPNSVRRAQARSVHSKEW